MTEPGARGRILIVDDQDPTRYVFRRILSGAGFDVIEARNGMEGLTKAEQLPDLIISDVNLPDMLGYDLVRRIKASALTSNIPVLQISATFFSDESKVQALEGGADSYLVQPVEPIVLIAQVHALIRMRKAESSSHLSAWQWQTTFDALSDGLALTGPDGVVLRANRTFLQMVDLRDSEVRGRPLTEIFEARFRISFAEFLSTQHAGQPANLWWNNRWFRARHDQVIADPAQQGGAIFLLTDVTQNRKLEETLKMSERLAATGRLAHIIAHEINNPLEALSNLLYLLDRNAAVDEMNRGFIQQAVVQLERIGQTTKQILQYHRETKRPIVAEGVDLVEGVLAMFRPQLDSKNISVRCRLRSSRSVYVYPGEMRQAFGNLVSNAVDAMEKTGGKLLISCFDSRDIATSRTGVRFAFSDSGAGISQQNLRHIFDAFFTTKDLKGSGIGLWLTFEIIAKHHGRIRVRTRTSGPRRGTIFDIFLPDHSLAVQDDRQIVSSPMLMKL